jgi:hypothetical protein
MDTVVSQTVLSLINASSLKKSSSSPFNSVLYVLLTNILCINLLPREFSQPPHSLLTPLFPLLLHSDDLLSKSYKCQLFKEVFIITI